MANYKVQGKLVVLAKSSPSSSNSEDFTGLSVDYSTYSAIIIDIAGKPSAALELRAKINAVATGYYSWGGRYSHPTTHAAINPANGTTTGFVIGSSSCIGAANREFNARMVINLGKESTYNLTAVSDIMCGENAVAEMLYHMNAADMEPVTQIEILTSTGTITGEIVIYGVKR
jgi:hypothetical protein